jgi:hypothetical protein
VLSVSRPLSSSHQLSLSQPLKENKGDEEEEQVRCEKEKEGENRRKRKGRIKKNLS